jgi:hypothetical protein
MIEHNETEKSNRIKRFFQRKSHFRYLLLGGVGLLAVTLILQLAWNVVVPALFGLAPITYWQALGLLALLRLTAGVMGLTRRQSKRNGFPQPRPGYYNHTFMACDSHRVI